MRTILLLPATALPHHFPEVTGTLPSRQDKRSRHNSALGHPTCREMTLEENVSQENNMWGKNIPSSSIFKGKKAMKNEKPYKCVEGPKIP